MNIVRTQFHKFALNLKSVRLFFFFLTFHMCMYVRVYAYMHKYFLIKCL